MDNEDLPGDAGQRPPRALTTTRTRLAVLAVAALVLAADQVSKSIVTAAPDRQERVIQRPIKVQAFPAEATANRAGYRLSPIASPLAAVLDRAAPSPPRPEGRVRFAAAADPC